MAMVGGRQPQGRGFVGLKDRIQGIRQYVTTPITVGMLELGSDRVVRAGEPARVVVKVEGENDGSVEGIDVRLRYSGGLTEGYRYHDLGEVPLDAGTHELTVMIPTGLAPSVARVNDYDFVAKTRRTKGLASDAVSPVDVISRPEDLYWPDGPRSGQDSGEDAVRIEIAVDAETADLGGTFTGTVSLFAQRELSKLDVELVAGATVTSVAGPQAKEIVKFKPFSEADLARAQALALGQHLTIPFTLELPAEAPPTVHTGSRGSVIWRLQVKAGKAKAWRTIGVLDPESVAGVRHSPQRAASWFLVDGYS